MSNNKISNWAVTYGCISVIGRLFAIVFTLALVAWLLVPAIYETVRHKRIKAQNEKCSAGSGTVFLAFNKCLRDKYADTQYTKSDIAQMSVLQ